MDICAELQIKDKPGVLLSVIEPVSMFGGNIITIVHDRENNFEDNLLLGLTIDIEQDKIDKLVSNWKSKGILVLKISEYSEIHQMNYMLIGDLSASQIDVLYKDIWNRTNIQNLSVEVSNSKSGEGTLVFSVSTTSADGLSLADGIISEASKKYGLVYVRGMGQ